jgi:hypothetical protein
LSHDRLWPVEWFLIVGASFRGGCPLPDGALAQVIHCLPQERMLKQRSSEAAGSTEPLVELRLTGGDDSLS